MINIIFQILKAFPKDKRRLIACKNSGFIFGIPAAVVPSLPPDGGWAAKMVICTELNKYKRANDGRQWVAVILAEAHLRSYP